MRQVGPYPLTDVVEGRNGILRWVKVGVEKAPLLTLLEPTGPGPLKKRIDTVGYGFYQLSFVVDDVAETIGRLRSRGLKIVIERADRDDVPGPETLEAFIHPRSTLGVLIQFQRLENYRRYLREG